MFDVYMQEQVIRPDRRVRLLVSLVLAATAVSAAGTVAMIAERLDIDAVPAINVAQTLTVILPAKAPPAPKPPPAVRAGSTKAAAGDAQRHAPPTPTEVNEVSDVPLESTRPASALPGGPTGTRIPGLGGPLPGTPAVGAGTCIVPPCDEGPARERPHKPPAMEPLDQMKMRGIYTPDPAPVELAKTPTGMGSRRSGAVTVDFCVEPTGKTSGVRIERSFGDRRVDAIARASVKRWRFRPMVVGGKGIKTCSEVTFRIEFE